MTLTMDKERVGIVGAGRMGLAILKHLLKRGYPAVACDIDDANRQKAQMLGATLADTPAELGKSVGFVILGVGNDREVDEVVLGPDGVLQSLARGSIIAVCSTVAPDTVKALDENARAKGCHVLDAPICRGRWFADEGQLLALFGGDSNVIERA